MRVPVLGEAVGKPGDERTYQLGHLLGGQPERGAALTKLPQAEDEHALLAVPAHTQGTAFPARIEEDLAAVRKRKHLTHAIRMPIEGKLGQSVPYHISQEERYVPHWGRQIR